MEICRAFASIQLEPTLRGKVEALQQRLASRLSTSLVRWTPAAQLHLTLKFFGDVESAQIPALIEVLRAGSAGSGMLQLALQAVGCFPTFRKPSVIWLGIGGDAGPLSALAGRLDVASRDFGAHREERAFHPHLTLGRVRNGPLREQQRIGASLEKLQAAPLGSWTARSIELLRSELTPKGSRYTRLAEIVL